MDGLFITVIANYIFCVNIDSELSRFYPNSVHARYVPSRHSRTSAVNTHINKAVQSKAIIIQLKQMTSGVLLVGRAIETMIKHSKMKICILKTYETVLIYLSSSLARHLPVHGSGELGVSKVYLLSPRFHSKKDSVTFKTFSNPLSL